MLKNYLDTFASNELFRNIHKEDISTMLGCLNPKLAFYERNDYIVMAGDHFTGVGIVLEGEATVSRDNAAGNRVVVTILGKGDIFGEMVAFSDHSKWPATVQAQGKCTVVFIPRNKIVGECERMCSFHRTLINNFLKILSQRALMMYKRLEYLTIKGIQAKIAYFLTDRYRETGDMYISLPYNRNELAEFLNVSRPSMSREMSKMRDEGIIDFHLSTVRIKDIKRLTGLCEDKS